MTIWDQTCGVEGICLELLAQQISGVHVGILSPFGSNRRSNCILRCWPSLLTGFALLHEAKCVKVRMGCFLIGMLVNQVVLDGTTGFLGTEHHSALKSGGLDGWDSCLCYQSRFEFDEFIFWHRLLDDGAEPISSFSTTDELQTLR